MEELRHGQCKQALYVEVGAISQIPGLAIFFNLWVLRGAFPENTENTNKKRLGAKGIATRNIKV